MLVVVLAAFDQTAVATALPVIARELRESRQMSWVFSAYLIASTVVIPLYGRLADHFGTKATIIGALALFVCGSLACGASQSLLQLILARALQGAGGGGLLTLAMVATASIYPPQQRGRALGVIGAVYGMSTLTGPLLGGWITDLLGWRWIFLINVPLGLLATGLVASSFPGQRELRKQAVDYLGALLLALVLILLLLSTQRDGAGRHQLLRLDLLGLAGVAFVGFLWHQSKADSPVMPLGLFQYRAFAGACLLAAGSGVALFVPVVFVPLYLQSARQLSPLAAAVHLLPFMAGIAFTSIGAGRWLAASGRAQALGLFGALVSIACQLAIPRALGQGHGLSIAAILAVQGIAVGMLFPVATMSCMVNAPLRLLGIATAAPLMFRSVGGAISLSLLGANLSATMSELMSLATPVDTADRLQHAWAAAISSSFVLAAAAGSITTIGALLLPARLRQQVGYEAGSKRD